MKFLRCAALLILLSAAIAVPAEEEKKGIPAFNELPEELLFPRNPEIHIAPDGELLINGVPRYLIGVTYYKDYNIPLTVHTPGYSAEWNWLYEHALDYEGAQRLGIDTVSTYLPDDWIEENGFRARKKYLAFVPEEMKKYFTSGIPLLLHLSPSGRIPPVGPGKPDASAFIRNPKNAAIRPLYYSFTTPAGRELWRTLWQENLKFVSSLGGSPVCCELFSSPSYDDRSEWNRRMFVSMLREKYHNDLNELNRMWQTAYTDFDAIGQFERLSPEALCIEWRKFMEDCVEALCLEAKKEIRAAMPNRSPLFSIRFSLLDEQEDNVDRYKISRCLDAISGQARSIYELRLLHAQAVGKLLVNPELKLARTELEENRRNGIRNRIWLDFIRGYNISYLFRWSKEVRDWKSLGIGNRLLDPRSFSTDDLAGILDAKQEIQKYGDAFIWRDRGMSNKVAVLYSCASERLQSKRNDCALEVAQAISDGGFGYDVIFEEALSGARDAERYRAIIAPNIHQSLDSTPKRLRSYVENGGTLFLFRGALEKNEYNFPRAKDSFPGIAIGLEIQQAPRDVRLGGQMFNASPVYEITSPHGWKTIGAHNLTPLCISRSFGKGQVYYLNVQMNAPDMCNLVTLLLNRCGVVPFYRILSEQTAQTVRGIEVWPARNANGTISYFLYNQTRDARRVRFIPLKGDAFYDPLNSRSYRGREGFPIYLPPQTGILLLAEKKTNAAVQPPLPAEPPSKYGDIFFCNLNDVVNCSFVDNAAFSGPGGDYGWLDIGQRGSLLEMPVGYLYCGRTMFRLTNNQKRENVVLQSRDYPERPKSVTISVGERAKDLVFLHTVDAHVPGGSEVCRYTICFADGTKLVVPIRFGFEVDDWRETRFAWTNAAGQSAKKYFTAWSNSYGRGLFAFRWFNNEKPDVPISSIIFSAVNPDAVPMLAAITGKRYAHEFNANLLRDMGETAPELPATGELKLEFPKPIPLPDYYGAVEILITAEGTGEDDFEVKVGNSQWLTAQSIQLRAKKKSRIYSIPESLFSLPGQERELTTLSFRRKASVPASRRIIFPEILLHGDRTAQPLALPHSVVSGNGLKVEQRSVSRLRLRFTPGKESGTLTLEYPERPLLEKFFPDGCFSFSCIADKEIESGEVAFEWLDQNGSTASSPWVKFHLRTSKSECESISGLLAVPRHFERPRLQRILFRFQRKPGGETEPTAELADFQLL